MLREPCHILCLLMLFAATSTMLMSPANGAAGKACIGAIVDDTSRAGKEETLAMKMAVEDFNGNSGDGSAATLYTKASHGDPVRAASAALSLINGQRVDALVGLHTWQEASFIAEIGKHAQVPVLSFTRAAPPSSLQRWPFLVRVARNQHAQMRAVAAVVGSWSWRRVAILYEDADYAATSIIPHLADALRAVGSEVDRRVPVPMSPSGATLRDKLRALNTSQCRVFVVHTSAKIAPVLFAEATSMGMMAQKYVWITTDIITAAVDSFNASTIASMQGVVGVRNYFNTTSSRSTKDLVARFKNRFQSEYPNEVEEEETRGSHCAALLAYDTIWAVASAIKTISTDNTTTIGNNHSSASNTMDSDETIRLSVSLRGSELLKAIRRVEFHGRSGEFRFDGDGEFAQPRQFQLVNVVGKSYTELGFWSKKRGFARTLEELYNGGGDVSMRALGPVTWPGRPWDVPSGWVPATSNPLMVAIPAKAVFPDFVSVKYDRLNNPSFHGFSINVFKAAVEQLHLPYTFEAVNGTCDSLMKQDLMQRYDILVGDTTISSARYSFVEFSQPYTESGLVMVVPNKMDMANRSWIFLRPFTATMWFLIAAIGIYNGVVIWLIERKFNEEYRVGFWNQVTIVFWLSFSFLLSPGERLHSTLSRMAMVVWFFVAIMLSANYTATLSSLLTVQRLEDAVTLDSLKSSGARVGCTNGSAVANYLHEVLMFPDHSIREFSSDDECYYSLVSGKIKAAFLRVSHAKLLLAKRCNELTTTGPVYHVGGLGFVFRKGSPLLSNISKAILEVFENGTIQKLESAMLSAYNCTSTANDSDGNLYRLNPENFWGLFVMTLFASTASLTVYGIFFHHDTDDSNRKHSDGRKDSATIDPGGHGFDGACAEHGGNERGMDTRIAIECELGHNQK